MLDPDIDSFLDVSVAHSFVDDDPYGGFCDVVYDAGFAVVDFVGHAVGGWLVLLCFLGFRYGGEVEAHPF